MIRVDKSWQLGKPQSVIYRLYDKLRTGLNRHLAQYFAQYVHSGRQRPIIVEAGSGPGYTTSFLKPLLSAGQAILIDYDADVLSIAKNRDRKIEVICADITAIPLQSNSADFIYNSSTLEHLTNPQTAVSEMVRVVKPGGHLFIGVPYKWGPLAFSLIFPKEGQVREWVGPLFTRNRLTHLVQSNNLKLVNTKTYLYRFFIGLLWSKSS